MFKAIHAYGIFLQCKLLKTFQFLENVFFTYSEQYVTDQFHIALDLNIYFPLFVLFILFACVFVWFCFVGFRV